MRAPLATKNPPFRAQRRPNAPCFYTLSKKLNIKSIAGKIKLLYNEQATILSALIFSRSKGIA
jgi:hypothetical protein